MRAVLRLLPLIAARRGLFIETVVWGAVTQTAVLGIGLGLSWMIGRVIVGVPVPLPVVAVILSGAAVLASLAAWRESWVGHDLAYRLLATMRGHLLDSLRRSLPSRTRHRRTGDMTTAALADVETLEWLYAHTVAQLLTAALVLSVSTAVSVAITPVLLLVWVPLLIVGVVVPLLTARRAGRDSAALAAGSAALRADALDTVRGMRDLTGAGAFERQLDRLTARTRELARLQTREASRIGAERGIADIALALAALGAILIVLLGGDRIAREDIPLAVTVAVAGLGPAAQIADLLRGVGGLRASAERIGDILAMPPAVADSRDAHPPREGERGLVLDRIRFSYDGGDPVLDGFALQIRPGEVVALTGPSGVGKTTAARLALRMWDPDDGAVRVDGVDIRDLPDDELRALVTAVPQSSPLLRGTIRENIVLGDPRASEERIREAADAAGLLDAATGLPSGLDTPIGEHGTGLSGGQRARVAIARALLPRPRVLVLDEPTASLDPEADAAILDVIRRTSDRAVLLIAHRPATIAAADRRVELGCVTQ
ncbi:ABC transporter ATP-binding protein [Microbacterium suaedae]|uniref:ABC transporter ATP-binding protein n=1 Tax=Microbacterium suaedae TaxID=2067813 RepID=UPI0013A63E33|nr:ABC transporter ATP-binding protein [Microbacterium suaedae]